MRLAPFDAHFPEGPLRDENLSERIIGTELSGVLNWALAGLVDWRTGGLGVAPEITEAVAKYKREAADVETFLAECCVVGPEHRLGGGEAWTAYKAWAEQHARQPVKPEDFRLAMAARFQRVTPGNHVFWLGVKLRS